MSRFIGTRTAFVAALLAVVSGATLPSTTHAEATAAKKGLAIGDAAPKWSDLEGTDGKKHDLADLKEADAVVVVFTCNNCPVAKAYEERLVAIDHDYKDKKVALVAVNVSNDELPAMKERAQKQGFEFAYLCDPSQEIGRKFGALVTPHAFVLDKARKVVYKGAIDDSQDAAKATKHHVRDAVDAVLAGKKPAVVETKQFGCGIGYE